MNNDQHDDFFDHLVRAHSHITDAQLATWNAEHQLRNAVNTITAFSPEDEERINEILTDILKKHDNITGLLKTSIEHSTEIIRSLLNPALRTPTP